MKIIPLPEGLFTIDKTKLFIPFNPQKDDLQSRPTGSLLVEVQPFAVVTSKDILLIDTGLGFAQANGQLQLHNNLSAAGIKPQSITKVLLSHLHKDHAGGISYGAGEDRLSFPEATYYVQKRELDYALQKGSPSFITGELGILSTSPQVQFLMEDEGLIDDYIQYQLTGGHSPMHQAFWIREGDETIFFGGDVAPQMQQMKMRYKTKYDSDPATAMQLRQKWWQQGAAEGWRFLFYHDIKMPVSTA